MNTVVSTCSTCRNEDDSWARVTDGVIFEPFCEGCAWKQPDFCTGGVDGRSMWVRPKKCLVGGVYQHLHTREMIHVLGVALNIATRVEEVHYIPQVCEGNPDLRTTDPNHFLQGTRVKRRRGTLYTLLEAREYAHW